MVYFAIECYSYLQTFDMYTITFHYKVYTYDYRYFQYLYFKIIFFRVVVSLTGNGFVFYNHSITPGHDSDVSKLYSCLEFLYT